MYSVHGLRLTIVSVRIVTIRSIEVNCVVSSCEALRSWFTNNSLRSSRPISTVLTSTSVLTGCPNVTFERVVCTHRSSWSGMSGVADFTSKSLHANVTFHSNDSSVSCSSLHVSHIYIEVA